MNRVCVSSCIWLLASGWALGQADLTVSVKGMRNDTGNVLISLFNHPDGFPDKSGKAFRVAIHPARELQPAVFRNLPPGTYAVAVCHDENGSLKLEKTLFGKPKEGVGVSLWSRKTRKSPRFDAARFKLDAQDRTITVVLHYY